MKVNVCFICLFFTFINAAISQKLYTTNLGSNSSTVIDTKTNTVINTIGLANNPFGVVTNPVLNKVYFSNYNSGSVSVLNPCSNNIEFIINSLGTNPSGMSVSPDGQRLYVSIHGENKIKVINTATNTVIATIIVGSLPVSAPHLSVVSHDNSKVYVTLFDEDKVAVINAVTNTVIGYYSTDSRPSGIDLSTDNSKLYVSNYYPPQLSVYNTTTGIRTNVVSLGSPVPNGVESAVDVVLNHANTKAYISIVNTSSVAVVNTATYTVTNTIPTGQRGLGIDIHPDDSKVYLSCANSNRIDVINTTTNVVTNSIAVGSNPYCIGRLLLHTNIDSVKITPTQISCLSYNFSGQAFVNSIPITGWQWYFGDGGQATTQNTSHSYAGTGTYTVKLVVTDANGCKDSTTTNVTTSQIAVNATNDTSICKGLSVQLNTTGATTYSWSPTTDLSNPNIPNPVATPTVTTKYYVTGTVSGGCSGVDSLTITVLALPNVVSSPDSNICAGMSIQLNTSGALSYSWSPATGLSNPSIANPVATPSVPTQYIVTGTAANGCTGKDTVNINLTPLPVVDATPDNNLCFGSSIQLNATGAVTYSWSPATGLSNTAIANPVASPSIATKYYVTGIAASGCKGIDSVTITLIPVPTIVTTTDSAICTGTSIQLNTIGAVSYSWSPATGLSNPSISNPIATPLVNTQYIVTGTAANGCIGKDTVNISLKPSPTITATNDSTICTGLSVQLNASGSLTYSWSPATGLSNPSIANPVATPLVPTQYIVTGTAVNGCSGKDTVNVNLTPLPVVDATPDNNLCIGSSMQLNATGAVTYSWSPATGLSNTTIPNPVALPIITTKYYVTGIAASGCQGIDSVTITLIPVPIIVTTIDSTICTGTSIQLNTTGAASYSWSPATGLSNSSIANPIATPLINTQYIVTGTAVNGCTAKDTVNISLKPLPIITATIDSTICPGRSVQLNSLGATSYSWSPATGLNNPSISNPIATPLVNTQYIVSGTGANGCTGKDTVNISLHPATVVDATPDNNLCTGSSMQLNATGAATYSWSPGVGLSSTNISNPIASPAITTKYYVTGTSANGCTGIDSVTISLLAIPVVVASIDSNICAGNSIQLNTAGAATYSWSPVTGLSNPSIANPIATPLVPTQYIVTGTAANSCTAKDTVNIGIKPLPVITKSNDTTICTAGSAQLNVTGGVTYSWTPVIGLNNPSIPNPVASPTTTTNYKVTVAGANSCIKLDSIKVTTAPAPAYTISSPSPICNNSSIQLLATGGDLYSWLPVTGLSNPTIANPQASPNITTPYAVRIISSVCHDTVFRATVVTVNQLPTISAIKSNDIDCSFPTAQLLATGGINYVWSPSTGLSNAAIANPIANITTTTTYIVTGKDLNNCTGTAAVTVQAGFVTGGNLYIPNAFTPNGDGKNDCFGVRVYGTVNSFELSVFNRYGEKVFYTSDPSKCWDGIYKTRKQQIGNYVYMVKAKSSCGDFFRKGNLVLLQ